MFTARNRQVKKKRININISEIIKKKKTFPEHLSYMDSMVEYRFGATEADYSPRSSADDRAGD